MTTQFDPNDPTRFEEMYRDERVAHGLPAATPWAVSYTHLTLPTTERV